MVLRGLFQTTSPLSSTDGSIFFVVSHALSPLIGKCKVNCSVVIFRKDILRLQEYLRHVKFMLPHGTTEKCWGSRAACWFDKILHVISQCVLIQRVIVSTRSWGACEVPSLVLLLWLTVARITAQRFFFWLCVLIFLLSSNLERQKTGFNWHCKKKIKTDEMLEANWPICKIQCFELFLIFRHRFLKINSLFL